MHMLSISGLIFKFALIIAKPIEQSNENALDLFGTGSTELFPSSLTSVKSSDLDDMFFEDPSKGNELCKNSPARLIS